MAGLMVDTDVLIDYLRDQPQAATFLESLKEPPCVSVVSVAELFAGVRDGAEREALEGMLSVCRVVDLSYETAMLGGLFRRDYGKSHGMGLADALIAASARHQGCRLATLNADFRSLITLVNSTYIFQILAGFSLALALVSSCCYQCQTK